MSMRRAINAKCKDCIYDPKAGGSWLAQVAACSCSGCPLWPLRPAPRGWRAPRDPATVDPAWVRLGHLEAIASITPAIAVSDRDLTSSTTERASVRAGPS